MSYVSLYKQLAESADRAAGEIAADLKASQDAEQRIDELEEAWDDAAEDGTIDAGELSRLRALIKQAGLGDLAELAGGELEGSALERATKAVEKAAERARRETTKGNDLKKIDLHLALDTLKAYYQGASDSLRREGEMYDNVVQNLRA